MDSVTLADRDLFEPGEMVEITTWVVIPAWCPMVVTGPTQVRGGKEYYSLLVPKDCPRDSRSHYFGIPVATQTVYVTVSELERNAICDGPRSRRL